MWGVVIQPGAHSGWKLGLRSELGWSKEWALWKKASLSARSVVRVIPYTSEILFSVTVSEQRSQQTSWTQAVLPAHFLDLEAMLLPGKLQVSQPGLCCSQLHDWKPWMCFLEEKVTFALSG